ncbi:DUF3263 domain-containing protein [Micromonospora echinofusca]|uniref:DUF3263 domain-containing protein n=1 Tax=Micromonospora echinofusca TaxID=47858 RepID=UPI0033C28B4F
MQPADAAPAATEPPATGRSGEPVATGEAVAADAPDAAGVVPHPRGGPVAAAPTVPQPRSAAEPELAVAPLRATGAADLDTGVPPGDLDTDTDTDAGPADFDTGVPADARPESGLTEREGRILAFERQWWRHAGAKEQAIRDTFGLSATRYYQLLNALLDNPAAIAAEPVLIGRLRRLRSSRARNRRR